MDNRHEKTTIEFSMNEQGKTTDISIYLARLNSLIREKSLSQSELERITGIRQATISDYTKGKSIPSAERFFLISSALGVSMDYLWGVSDVPIQATDTANIQESEWQQRAQTAEQKLKHLKSLLSDVGSDIEALGGTIGKLLKFISE
jgi:transcriptional regulator with XRE-family HTH domain|nr:MAG TPA: Repressor protein CI [Caudoviricetes sp.]